MAYHCSNFKAYCLLIWWGKKTSLRKVRLHIFVDVGVATAELSKIKNQNTWVGPGFYPDCLYER